MKLNWCVGRFVYFPDSNEPIHFMQLKDFHLEPALDMTAVVSYRVSRVTGNEELTNQHELSEWTERMGVRIIGDLVYSILKQMPDEHEQIRIIEFYPRLGLVFEYLKLIIQQRCIDHSNLSYLGIGPESLRHSFLTLHDDHFIPHSYVSYPISKVALSFSDISVYNHHAAIRYMDNFLDVIDWMAELQGPGIMVVRVSMCHEDQTRCTVEKRLVNLPSIHRIINCCQERKEQWLGQLFAGFDEGYLMPGEDVPTGLLVAYKSSSPLSENGYLPITKLLSKKV